MQFLAALRPMVRAKTIMQEWQENKGVRAPVSYPLPGYLIGQLALDEEDVIRNVGPDELDRCNISAEFAWRRAKNNLLDISAPNFEQVAPGVYTGRWSDGYDASRLLLPLLFQALPGLRNPVIAIPVRDVLLACDAKDIAALEWTAHAAQQSHESRGRPVSAGLFCYKNGTELAVFEGGRADGKHMQAFNRYWVGVTYAQQKEVLQARFAKLGANVEVGEHTVSRVRGDELCSYCIWEQGYDTLLPAADFVVFGGEGKVFGQMRFDEFCVGMGV